MNKNKLIKLKVYRDTPYCEYVMVPGDNGLHFVYKVNIKGLETGECVSWYFHDIFKKLTYIYWNGCNKDPKFYLEESKLYNKRKLTTLYNSENFQKRKYAFFFYGVVERLLGKEQTASGMSGFLPKGESLF